MALLNVRLSKYIVKEPDIPTPPEPEKKLTLFEVGQKINGLQFNVNESVDLSKFSNEHILFAENQYEEDFSIRYYDLKGFGASGKALFIEESKNGYGGFYYLYSDTNVNIDGIEIKEGWNLEILNKDNIYKLPQEYTIREIDQSATYWNGISMGAVVEEVQGLSMLKVNQRIGGFDFGNVQDGEISPEMENFLASVDISNGNLYELVALQQDNVEGSLSIGYIEGVHYLAFSTLVDKIEDKGVLLYLDKDDPDFGARGWHNITDGKVGLVSSDKMRITYINDTIPPTWNGVLIGAVEEQISEPDVPQPVEPIDIYLNEAITIQANSSQDYDSMAKVRFIPTETAEYSLTSLSNKDTYGYLYDNYGNIIAQDDDNGNDNNFKITQELVAGETYIYAVRFYSENVTDEMTLSLTKVEQNGLIPIYDNDTFNGLKFNTTLHIDSMRELCEQLIDPNKYETGVTQGLMSFYGDTDNGSVDLIYEKTTNEYWLRVIQKSYGEDVIWASNYDVVGANTIGWQRDSYIFKGNMTAYNVNMPDSWNGNVIGKEYIL